MGCCHCCSHWCCPARLELETLAQYSLPAARAKDDKKQSELHSLQSQLAAVLTEKEALEGTVATLTSQLETLRTEAAEERKALQQRLADTARQRDCIKLVRNARIGLTGKYYCNKPLGEDVCGPVAGSNCVECQKLDIWARDLPRGFLVNSEGRIVRRGRDAQTWYCGARVLEESATCDGWCGPSSGPQCTACSYMQDLARTRYQELIDTQS